MDEVVLDRAFDSDAIRELLVERDIAPCIPSTANRTEPIWYDTERDKERNMVERLFNRLKQFRRVATRYEKRAANYLAFVHFASIIIWLRV